MKILFTFFPFLFILVNVLGQDKIKVNEKAPEVNITDWIANIPEDKSLENKYIVLEFWATWCAPCLAAVPHLNEMKAAFEDKKDLYFISISDENVTKIQNSLKRVEMKTIVVSDQTGNTFTNFGVRGIPRTIMIDNKGIIKWIGTPYNVNKKLINDFISGQTIMDSIDYIISNSDKLNEEEKQLYFQLEVSKGEPDAGSSSSSKIAEDGLTLEFQNFSFKKMISSLKKISEKFIIGPKSLENELYNVSFFNPKFTRNRGNAELTKTNLDDGYEALVRELQDIFNLEQTIEKRMEEVYILEVIDESKLEISDEQVGHMSSSADFLLFSSQSIDDVTKGINTYSGKLFVNNTNLNQKYDFHINIKSFDDIITSLESYGLKVNKAQKEIEYIKFE